MDKYDTHNKGGKSKRMIIMLVGLPGCGKSTYANTLNDFTVLSSDTIRKEIYGSEDVQSNPKRVFDILYQRMELLLKNGQNVVLDATNIKKCDRKQALAMAKKYNQPIEALVFDLPLSTCLYRNNQRERVAPFEVYERMTKQFEMPTLDEGFIKISIITE